MNHSPAIASAIACHDCDLIYRVIPLATGCAARCQRCGSLLYQEKKDSLDRTLTLTLTAMICFVIANVYPFLVFKVDSHERVCTILSGSIELYDNDEHMLAAVVFLSSILIPFLKIAGLLYLLIPLKLGRKPWGLSHSYRILDFLQPWGMLEVYMIGVLVSLIKLSSMATIILGTAFYAFIALIILTSWATACFDSRIVWRKETIST